MTDESYAHILVVADRSGSMASNHADKEMAQALNDYLREQAKVPGKCLVDYVQFDNVPETVFTDTPAAHAEAVIVPRGSTALLDAIGIASVELGKKLKRLPEALRPGRVQVVIVTDGGENSSRTWRYHTVKELITEQTNKYNWDFVFLGANIDAVAVGDLFGINYNNAMTFDLYNPQALADTTQSLSNYTTTYRGTGKGGNFTEDDRDKAVGKTPSKS